KSSTASPSTVPGNPRSAVPPSCFSPPTTRATSPARCCTWTAEWRLSDRREVTKERQYATWLNPEYLSVPFRWLAVSGSERPQLQCLGATLSVFHADAGSSGSVPGVGVADRTDGTAWAAGLPLRH